MNYIVVVVVAYITNISCGADILRWRREKELERRKLVALGILKEVPAITSFFGPSFELFLLSSRRCLSRAGTHSFLTRPR